MLGFLSFQSWGDVRDNDQ